MHTDIGNSAHKAKINGEVKTLDTILKNGDIVNILTKKNSTATLKIFTLFKNSKSKIKTKTKTQLKKKFKVKKKMYFLVYYNNKKLLELYKRY